VLIVSAALLLVAAAGVAAVMFIPSLSALAGIERTAPSSAQPEVSGPASATASASATPSAASPSATATPTFQMAPEITSPPPVAPTASAAATSPATGRSSLDLGLAVPVNIVPCNGKYLTFYSSAINPATYASEIQASLNARPGASYLVTEGSCSALNQVSKDGTRIYGVYSGPHATAAAACQALAGVPGGYVKVMNPSTNPEATVACG
jgi:serine/threonine-protein kinase